MSGASQQKSAALQIKGSPPSAKRFNKRVLGILLGGSALAILMAAGFALRSPDSEAVAPQELYNTTSKTLPDALNKLPENYSEVETSPQFGILGPPLPGDIGAGLYGKPKEIPTDNPFRYQPPSTYAPPPAQRYGGGSPQARRMLLQHEVRICSLSQMMAEVTVRRILKQTLQILLTLE